MGVSVAYNCCEN